MLQPLIFWFDSQHLCHIQRYLAIYSPYVNLPEEMKSWLGEAFVKDMILRKGDFIEDRFGQMQRRCLTKAGQNDAFMLRAFRWFGSYLAWIPDPYSEMDPMYPGSLVFVGHLRGRQTKSAEKLEEYRTSGSKRLELRAECEEWWVARNAEIAAANVDLEQPGEDEEEYYFRFVECPDGDNGDQPPPPPLSPLLPIPLPQP